MKRLFTILLLAFSLALTAKYPDPASILRAIDANTRFTSLKSTTRMVIKSRRASRTVSSINYSKGDNSFFSEYTSPPRDKGTKMLKLGGNLWIYNPGTDRIVQISGNMLNQSVMGSDLSYEDFMEENSLLQDYNAVIEGEATYDKREVWNIMLTAKRKGLSYPKKRIYVDKERLLPLYEQWFSSSGKLLKTVRSDQVSRIGNRWYPKHVVFKDELKEGSGTDYYVDSIAFDLKIPDAIFSKGSLKK
ncbi:MAG TPA: outer membrane lipoprotein-sorting protein [Candidatus Cloacimonadota bacterium]|nr:outer membrane lipoprotein-sorting protein [Candidatus Cloacimonadota bacterium]